MTLQRQCCECKFWEAAKPPDLGGSCLRGRICVIGAQSTQTLGHSMRESCPRKHHPKLLQSLAVRMQCGRQVRKDVSSSLSREGGEARYSCFAMYLQFAVILSYFTCTDSLEEVLLAWEGVPVPGIPGVHGQGYTVPSPSEGYD